MPISDTSPEMREAYYRRLAEMTPSERVRIMADLWEGVWAMSPRLARRSDFESAPG